MSFVLFKKGFDCISDHYFSSRNLHLAIGQAQEDVKTIITNLGDGISEVSLPSNITKGWICSLHILAHTLQKLWLTVLGSQIAKDPY